MIELQHVSKIYDTGKIQVHALNDISLDIAEGEFIAIMGPSGSGKSTLLNILGFLDKPDAGSYFLLGNDISSLSDDELSLIRNRTAGFVFQQFNLLPRMTALDNVGLPMIYAGKRDYRASSVEQLGHVMLSHREEHYPNELSGGEQQRVAIARAMVNNPMILFADEPTGNLDTKSEEEIIALLKSLNESGITIIMVTHENEIAAHAKRIIRMRDGKIISDERKTKVDPSLGNHRMPMGEILREKHSYFGSAEFVDYLRQALGAIFSHKMRSLLSMLGILIGVAAVISMIAIGEGAKQQITDSMSELGSNVVSVHPGSRKQMGVAMESGKFVRFTINDSAAISRLPEVKNVSPSVSGTVRIVFANNNWSTMVRGTSAVYPYMKASIPVKGRFFNNDEVQSRKKVAVIGNTIVKEVFGGTNPVGKTVKINRVNFTVIGVLPVKGMAFMHDQDDIIIVPITTAMYRLLGKEYIDSMDVEIGNPQAMEKAISSITDLIIKRHRLDPVADADSFEVHDMAEIRDMISSTTQTMSLLLGIVAAISLFVGGIGIMNIMLVSVKERIKEIGLRKAIGARRKDILVQFLIESSLLTLAGGIFGILVGSGISVLISVFAQWSIKISPSAIFLSTFFSIMIGIGFGLWPAVQASRLNPIEALRYE